MSLSRLHEPEFKLEPYSDPILDEFKKIHSVPTLELINNFLKNGDAFSMWVFEQRFKLDEIKIPKEGIYKKLDKKFPEIEKEVSDLFVQLNQNYEKDPNSLSGHELAFLGKAYEFGVVMELNVVKAHHLYMEAVEKGCLQVAVDLGVAFIEGSAFMQDTDLALKFFELGKNATPFALLGLAQHYLDEANKLENEIEENSETTKEKETFFKKAREFFELAASKEEPNSLFILGMAYYTGDDLAQGKQNKTQAIAYLERSAKRGCPEALLLLALDAIKPDANFIKINSYLYFASEFGSHIARGYFANFFHLATDDVLNAISDFERSEDIPLSLKNLGLILSRGVPDKIEPNLLKAVGYLRRALDQTKDSKDKVIEDELKKILTEHEKLPPEKKNIEIPYHAAIALGKEEKEIKAADAKTDVPNTEVEMKAKGSDAKIIFTALAREGSETFEKLSDKDSWERVKKMILDSKAADEVLAKKMSRLQLNSQTLDKALPPTFPTDLQNLMLSYSEDAHPDYLKMFFQLKKRKAESEIPTQEKKPKLN